MSHYISTNRSKHYLKCHLILVTPKRLILLGFHGFVMKRYRIYYIFRNA